MFGFKEEKSFKRIFLPGIYKIKAREACPSFT
jgi:hypothetical protein